MFNRNRRTELGVSMGNCRADSYQTCMYPVSHTNGRSIKNMIAVVKDCLVGMGLMGRTFFFKEVKTVLTVNI